MSKIIYLDNAATTPMHPKVLEAMIPFLKNNFGNASSLHSLGKISREAIDSSRGIIAEYIGASPKEVLFTGGGTESDNIAILGTARSLKKFGTHLITSNIEHPAVFNSFRRLQLEGFKITYIPVNSEGLINIEDIKESIRKDTILISIMFANNEIGTIQPIKAISEIANDNEIIFHTDAVQAFGKIPINLSKLKINLLSASSHKIYGPKGIGLLFMRNKGIHHKYKRYIQPVLFGGGQESGYRPSTENVAGIVGFSKAVELSITHLNEERDRIRKMRDDFINWVLKNIPFSYLNGHPTKRLENNINLRFDGVEGGKLLEKLDEKSIAVSTGSACHSRSKDVSYVLRAIGLEEEAANSSIRITLGRTTTQKDLEHVKVNLKEFIEKLRN